MTVPRLPDPVVDEAVEVGAGRAQLAGHLTVPADARGVVVFVHGSGSSRGPSALATRVRSP